MKAAIIGTGDLETETKQAIAEYHAEHSIDMLGYSSNPYGAMKQAKILIMTSRWEGLPMCALEAMALGVPIVSTPTDGLKEIVDDGKTGYLSDDDDVLIEHCTDVLEIMNCTRTCITLHWKRQRKFWILKHIRKHWIRFIGKRCKETIGGEEISA